MWRELWRDAEWVIEVKPWLGIPHVRLIKHVRWWVQRFKHPCTWTGVGDDSELQARVRRA